MVPFQVGFLLEWTVLREPSYQMATFAQWCSGNPIHKVMVVALSQQYRSTKKNSRGRISALTHHVSGTCATTHRMGAHAFAHISACENCSASTAMNSFSRSPGLAPSANLSQIFWTWCVVSGTTEDGSAVMKCLNLA